MSNRGSKSKVVGRVRSCFVWAAACIGLVFTAVFRPCSAEPMSAADDALPDARAVPGLQVVPLPYDQAAFVLADGREITRFHFGPQLQRPFLFPLAGPAGHSLTRMGHPHDPITHSHHNSVWMSHQDLAGEDFWKDGPGPRIRCRNILRYEDATGDGTGGPAEAWLLADLEWLSSDGNPLLRELRRIAVRVAVPGESGAWLRDALAPPSYLILWDSEFRCPGGSGVTFSATPFGLMAVRVAKTIGVRDGGGRILDSEGRRNEVEIFRKPARWVDYSGPIGPGERAGVALFDHPVNPGHPTPFHVRDDGWMGACLTLNGAVQVTPDKPLRLRYGIWAHGGVPTREAVEKVWQPFAEEPLPVLQP